MPVIKLKRSSVSGTVPSVGSLTQGELYLNTADGKLFLEKSNGSVIFIGQEIDSDSFITAYNSAINSGGISNSSGSSLDSDWIIRQISIDQIDSDWVLNNAVSSSSSSLDSEWVLNNTKSSLDSDWVMGRIHSLDLSYLDSDYQAKRYLETIGTAAINGANVNFDLSTGNVFKVTYGDPITFNFLNLPTGTYAFGFTIVFTANTTGTITWPASVKWPGGSAPDFPALGETDVYNLFTPDSGTTFYAVQSVNAAS